MAERKYKLALLIILILLLIAAVYPVMLLNKVKYVPINKNDSELGKDVSPELAASDSAENINGIENFALFGLDGNKYKDSPRSDAILIFTVDLKNKKLKISSIMRDLRVKIEGHGVDKINHAYRYGGPELAIKTLNQNLGTNIKDFIAVDFYAMERAIDNLGGVYVNVKDGEIPFINENISNKKNLVMKSGPQLLNGEQSVAYARVRKSGNGDFERTERQRKILAQLLEKVEGRGFVSIPGYVEEMLPYVQTSMDKYKIVSVAVKCFKEGVNTLELERFPADGYWKDENVGGTYFLTADLDMTRRHMYDFLFRDLKAPSKN